MKSDKAPDKNLIPTLKSRSQLFFKADPYGENAGIAVGTCNRRTAFQHLFIREDLGFGTCKKSGSATCPERMENFRLLSRGRSNFNAKVLQRDE